MHDTVELDKLSPIRLVLTEKKGRSYLTTTLYDLIAALHTLVEADEDDWVSATVVHLLRTGRVVLLREGMLFDQHPLATSAGSVLIVEID